MRIHIKNFIAVRISFHGIVFSGVFIFLILSSVFVLQVSSYGPTYVSGVISTTTVWTLENSPYVVEGDVFIYPNTTLTIEPGVIVKFAYPDSQIRVNGTLNAQGIQAQPVYFTSIKDDSVGGDTNNDGSTTFPQSGDWASIRISQSGAANLNHTIIRYGGYSAFPYGNIALDVRDNGTLSLSHSRLTRNFGTNLLVYLSNATVVSSEIDHSDYGIQHGGGTMNISNSSIHDNAADGIINGYGGTLSLTDNNFQNNNRPVFLSPEVNFIHSGTNAANNDFNGIGMDGNLYSNRTWTKDLIPYVIFSGPSTSTGSSISTATSSVVINSNANLTIDPGVVVKFAFPGSAIIINANGTLNANGTESQPVYFTSIKDDTVGGDTNNDGSASSPVSKDWSRIELSSSSATANISHAIMRYGGDRWLWYSQGATIRSFGNLSLSHSSISASEDGLTVGGGTANINLSEIFNNSFSGISQGAGTVNISNSSIHDNADYGAYSTGPNIMNAQNNFWGDSTGPYHSILNLNGLGNRVSDNVNFIPWLLQSPLNPPTISNLGQFKSDATTIISEGQTTTEDIVVFKGTLNSPVNNQVKLEVELRQFSEPFTGLDDGGILKSGFVSSGSVATSTRFGLVDDQYHWRARTKDINGNTSDWVEFGVPSNVDFEVKLVPLFTQIRSNYPSDDETKIWAELDYAEGSAGNYDCGYKIRQCGCAITSEIMIMRFYGIVNTTDGKNVDPAEFNEWLINNNGYYSNGDIKWPKINDYTKDQFGIPRLAYSGPVNSENTNILDGQLNNLQPAILSTKVLNTEGKLVNHFIVADGKLSTTYTVKDPIYYLTRNLNQSRSSYIYDYDNHFVSLRLFSSVAILPDSISAHLASPGELLFTDSQGRKLGKDPINNIEYNEVPNGVYYQESIGNPESDIVPEESKNIWIPDPIDGQYDIQIIGTETGSYTLGTLIYDQNGDSKDIVQEGTTTINNIQNFELDYSSTTVQQSEIYRIVDIDIKPGSYPNSINLKSKGTTPVAIITTPFFDAEDVIIDSILFTGAKPTKGKLEDVDNDKDLDLILHFDTQSLQLTPADTEAVLTGKLKDNTLIKGIDPIKIIQEPNKRTAFSKFFSFVGQFIINLISAIGSIAT